VQSPPGTLRLFFALTPNAAQKSELAERAAPLVTQLRAQCVPPENLHVTLAFVGSVAEEKLSQLRDIAAGIRSRPATLCFDALEHWEKVHVLCATASDPLATAPSSVLAERLASASAAAGFSPDIKPFRAHLTLARKVPRASAATCDWPRVLTPPVSVHFDRFVLMQSQRGESGSIYSVVDSWPLYENGTS
jgi:RNA 2',3'-cyclic 3'-phosphodiesterase